ncbi:MAG: ATP-dependent RecD-like DNA helicase [Bacilli bacterium]|nr:ATP-dependent RecD-like DNA helicase [Bacilli bacterium]MDD4407265.1 ATP-dependent RecD-like DNA helicase [Bacilli bacterium]
MNLIKGKYKKTIFESDAGYLVGLFRVYETDSQDIEKNKTITITGYLPNFKADETYLLKGIFIDHIRYGFQFEVHEFEKPKPDEKESIIELLASSFIKGCGIKTAEKIYNLYGNDSLNKIKENKDNLLLVSGMTEKKASKIYDSIIKYYKADDDITYLKKIGFSLNDTMKLINLYGSNIKDIIENNIYDLSEDIEFKKLDSIFLQFNNKEAEKRINALIIHTMKELTFKNGDIYLDKIEIIIYLEQVYNITNNINENLEQLVLKKEIIIENEDYYLTNDYLDEVYNGDCIYKLIKEKPKIIIKFDKYLKEIEKKFKIIYSEEQSISIKRALENSISIITGSPGTGKTTIIKGIIEVYKKIYNISCLDNKVLLLAPTGRAAKKITETTGYQASTIHRFLKWDKERNVFKINEFNKQHYKLIIIDEVSMIDNHLLASLFKGNKLHTQIVFVGDEYQLPSVRPGLILNDMINTDLIIHTSLKNIYRQSENSFIPILAKDIKEVNINENILYKKDDYNFIVVPSYKIKDIMKAVLVKCKEKNINENKIQVLAPMYKGENGIDNLNLMLQNIFNPKSKKKLEFKFGNIIFRNGDKVLNLINDIDFNISNGDIGYIIDINPYNKDDILTVDYDGNIVPYKREKLNTIIHAYAISIHKSQGSEFDHIIMPITMAYSRMLYNKLIYTGISRAKKSLILIGEPKAFEKAVYNNYSVIRKTKLKQKILNNINNNG